MRVFFHTLGCKVNRYETEYMRDKLLGSGYEPAKNVKDADVIILNSCTVTAESDRKTRQLTRRFKRQNHDSIILLTGCMPQAFPKEAEQLPADIILGNSAGRNVLKSLELYLTNHNRIVDITPHQKGDIFGEGELNSFSERTRAYMKIEDGCDRGCRYCIIPKARGRVRSRSLESIKKEGENLRDAGFSEIVLVGINLSSYGSDIGVDLADAVLTLADIKGINRIRLGSLEPDLTDTAFLEKLKTTDKFCPQFHLSLQSGCDETLKRMNRLYTADFYENLVKEIRSIWDDATVTTDIMVGFVGETEQEFQKSLEFAKKIRFLKAHIFPYSIRSGTFAEKMNGHIPEEIKTKRAGQMAEVCDGVTTEVLAEFSGKTFDVLFEHFDGEYVVGHTKNFVEVFVKSQDKSLLKTEKSVLVLEPYKTGVLAKI